jgi:threonine dehydrogenase-like Zn-dependent dehydrogenase
MKQVKMDGNSSVRVVEVPDLEPGPGEVVVQTAASALCGSELKGYRTTGCASGNIGHEAAGVVARLGAGVTGLKTGQRVGVSAIAGCGECDPCRQGRYTWCRRHKFFGNMHAERLLASARACHVLPDDVPWDPGVLLSGDGLGVPYHTSLKLPPATRTVAIFGMGPIGLGNALLQAHLGRRVIAIDLVPWRLELAGKLGAAHTLVGGQGSVVEEIKALTLGEGADVAIEAAGRPETAKACFKAVRHGGLVVFNGEQPAVELSPSDDFIRRDIAAVGAWYYHFCEFKAMLELYRAGLRVGDLITHHFPLDQADEAFRLFASGQTGKVLLSY